MKVVRHVVHHALHSVRHVVDGARGPQRGQALVHRGCITASNAPVQLHAEHVAQIVASTPVVDPPCGGVAELHEEGLLLSAGAVGAEQEVNGLQKELLSDPFVPPVKIGEAGLTEQPGAQRAVRARGQGGAFKGGRAGGGQRLHHGQQAVHVDDRAPVCTRLVVVIDVGPVAGTIQRREEGGRRGTRSGGVEELPRPGAEDSKRIRLRGSESDESGEKPHLISRAAQHTNHWQVAL